MRKLQYLGHSKGHNKAQLQLVEGHIEGWRSQGRHRTTWTTDLTDTTGANDCQLKGASEYRSKWCGLLVNLTLETSGQVVTVKAPLHDAIRPYGACRLPCTRVNRKVWHVARMSRTRENRVKMNYSSFYFRADSATRAGRLPNQSAADI